jgi:ferrous iron transport protein B
MDYFFKKCDTCGKQALTMCMGFGCNAVGVIGCRIIDSPRERLIAMLTNAFVPCNGRFPTLIAIITMFFAFGSGSILSTLILTAVVILGIFMTLLISKILSKTLLRGIPSSFTLELPPFRKPQIGRIITRSIFDRTLFVLGRAVAIAAPAGALIWIMNHIFVNSSSLLQFLSAVLDPAARLIGLDGVIILAFILGFPANEIVIPIILMIYLSIGGLTNYESLDQLKIIFIEHGWTWRTALCAILFSLMHWPCSTTCLTIFKETRSVKWTALSFLIPAMCGVVLCFFATMIIRLFF